MDTFVHEYKAKHPTETIPSTKTIYRYIAAGLLFLKPIDFPKIVSIRKRTKAKTTVNKKSLGKSIENRPEMINSCSEFGNWEKEEAVVMTLVERQTRFALACKLPNKQAETINAAVKDLLTEHPIFSITSDNRAEFSLLSDLEGVDSYLAHPYSSHERGTNENFNGLLR